MNHNNKVVTRFAPSPTGFMHIGGVRTALYAFLWARKHNGTFILRIEDTDKAREVSGSVEHIMETLRWLHIDWDYGPDSDQTPFGSCIQSERLASYQKYAELLIERGLAYPDPYSAEEIETFRAKAKAAGKPFLYREYRPTTFMDWDKTKPLRLKVPEVKRYTWQDAVRGELSAGEEMLDDIILIKSDGYPTYNFAHIIDDHEMGVTHIMRSDEFISSQPKFLSIYDALGFTYPTFVTLPPILRDDRKKKLGKRDGAKDTLDYKRDGYLPEAMVNFLALIGWNPGTSQEIFNLEELITAFDINKIQRAGAAFNEEKLDWLNRQHLLGLSQSEQNQYIKHFIPTEVRNLPQYSAERENRLLPTIRERVQVGREVIEQFSNGEYNFAFVSPNYERELLKWKKDTDHTAALPRLQKLMTEIIPATDFTSIDSIKAGIMPYAETEGRGEVLWPLRVALSGREQSPDPFTIAYILGKEETLSRLGLACAKIGE